MTPLMLCLTTIGGCFFGSVIPLINTELVVLAAAAAAPPSLALPIILIASISQMAGKAVLYHAGSGLIALPRGGRFTGRITAQIDAGVARVQKQQRASSATLFASASTGLPPFYVMSIASGVLGVDFKRFLAIGLAGRTLRFSAIVLIPQLIKSLL